MSEPEYNTGGVVHGRFQVLHKDHMKYIMAGKQLCGHLVVGITNPDPSLTLKEDADPKRNMLSANPLTYYERYLLVTKAFEGSGVKSHEFSIVPFPINFPELYKYYVPMDAVFFLTIYDEWGKQKLSYLQSQGLKTHVLWEIPYEQKGISASEIRNLMINGKPWEHLVPESTAVLMKKWMIPDILKQIKENGK